MKKTKAALQAKADGGNEDAKARLATFETAAGAFAKKVIGNFKDYEFFTGESMDPDGMVVLMNYREDGVTPYMIFWKDGLREVSRVCYALFIVRATFLTIICDPLALSDQGIKTSLDQPNKTYPPLLDSPLYPPTFVFPIHHLVRLPLHPFPALY